MINQEISQRILQDNSSGSELPIKGHLSIGSLQESNSFNDPLPCYSVPGVIPFKWEAEPGVSKTPVSSTFLFSPLQPPPCLSRDVSRRSNVDIMSGAYHESTALQLGKAIGIIQKNQGKDAQFQRRQHDVSNKSNQHQASPISVFDCPASPESPTLSPAWYESQPIVLSRHPSLNATSISLPSFAAACDNPHSPQSPLPITSPFDSLSDPCFEIDLSEEAKPSNYMLVDQWKPTLSVSQSSNNSSEAAEETAIQGSTCGILPLKLFYSLLVEWWSGQKQALSQSARDPIHPGNRLDVEDRSSEKATDQIPNSGDLEDCSRVELERFFVEDPFATCELPRDQKAEELIIADDDKCYSSPLISAFAFRDPTPTVTLPRSALKKNGERGKAKLTNCPSRHVRFMLEENSAPSSPTESFDACEWECPSNGTFFSRQTTTKLNGFHLDRSSSSELEDFDDDNFEPLSLMESPNVAVTTFPFSRHKSSTAFTASRSRAFLTSTLSF